MPTPRDVRSISNGTQNSSETGFIASRPRAVGPSIAGDVTMLKVKPPGELFQGLVGRSCRLGPWRT